MINKERYHDYDVNVLVLLSTLKYNTHTFIYVIKTLWLFNQNNCLNCHKYQTSPFSYCSGFSQPKIWQLLYSVSQINWSFIPNLMEIIIWSEVSTTKLKMLNTFNSVKSSPIPQQQVGGDESYSISLATARDLTELIKCQHSNYLIFITKAI